MEIRHVSFDSFYELVKHNFSTNKSGDYKRLLGAHSDEEAYIDAYIMVDNKRVRVLTYLNEWFHNRDYGTMLLYGDPGSGKTTLCRKAMVEFYNGNFLKASARNVLTVSLNTGANPKIITNGTVNLEAALSWGPDRRNTFTFEDCRGALLFFDGFEEFIDDAKRADINNIVSFMRIVDDIAFEYSIHIVVLSATLAIADYLDIIGEKSCMLLPITKQQQDAWLERHNEYKDYCAVFQELRSNIWLNGLLGNPFLFRLFVHSRFNEAYSNNTELYDLLFEHLMVKNGIYGEYKEMALRQLCNLAYEIYCSNTDTAEIGRIEGNEKWLFAFYIAKLSKGRIGFTHRSFYQYFLAKFIYYEILNTTNTDGDSFIGLFAERELDDTVCQFLSLMIKEEDKDTIYLHMGYAVDALIETEAYLNLTPRYSYGNAERSRIGRTTNIYRNTLRICTAISYVIQRPFKDGLDTFLRTYRSDHLSMYSSNKNRIDLSFSNLIDVNLVSSNLERANLNSADLRNANLSKANLSGTTLCGAFMTGANLVGCNLSRADLTGANLSGAYLNGADLSGADLSGAVVSEAIMTRVNLRGANLNNTNLSRTNLANAFLTESDLSDVFLSEAILTGAALSEANLSGGNLTKANLKESNLSGATLTDADLSLCNLKDAVLSDADLSGANLTKANMSGTNLIRANLTKSNLSNAYLIGAKLQGAILKETIMTGIHTDNEFKDILQSIRKLPVGVQSFEQIITNRFTFVDKTEYIYSLVHNGKSYFLSRPRRFGKSLLLSTLKAYWEGRKDLFHGLKIEEMEKRNPSAWQDYPIFYFDFIGANYKEENALEAILKAKLNEWEDIYGHSSTDAPLGVRFGRLLRSASNQTGKNCVILVDEYDKPLLESMENEALIERNRAVFKGFFSALKSEDSYTQFIFITGVTKFSKTSIFSDLNQLLDISMDKDYAEICGFTHQEVKDVFIPEIGELAKEQKFSQNKCLKELKNMYDGYKFHEKSCGVYNPYSTLTALFHKEFESYWFSTGTPSFLIKRLKDFSFEPRKLADGTLRATKSELMDYRDDNPDPIPLLYQTGYLTITGFDKKSNTCKLSFPNNEVKYGLLKSMMPVYVNGYGIGSGKDILSLKQYIEEGVLDGVRDIFKALFASIPYATSDKLFEYNFQAVFFITLTLLGQFVACEEHTFMGRIDCILKTKKYVYIFEFKRDGTAKQALKQIEDNRYADPYAADKRKLYKIGVNFDSTKRQLTEWEVLDKEGNVLLC